jgi:hypothetical protein
MKFARKKLLYASNIKTNKNPQVVTIDNTCLQTHGHITNWKKVFPDLYLFRFRETDNSKVPEEFTSSNFRKNLCNLKYK